MKTRNSVAGNASSEDGPSFMRPTHSSEGRWGSNAGRVSSLERAGRLSGTGTGSLASIALVDLIDNKQRDGKPSDEKSNALETSSRFKTRRHQETESTSVLKSGWLSNVAMFKDCSPQFLEMMCVQVDNKVFEQGEDIVRQGEIGTCMYIVVRGDIEILVNDKPVTVLGDGSVFGEMAAVCKDPLGAKRSATVRAKSLCHCRVIERDVLLRILARFPPDERIIQEEVERRLSELHQKGFVQSKSQEMLAKAVAVTGTQSVLPQRRTIGSLFNTVRRSMVLGKTAGDSSPSRRTVGSAVVPDATAAEEVTFARSLSEGAKEGKFCRSISDQSDERPSALSTFFEVASAAASSKEKLSLRNYRKSMPETRIAEVRLAAIGEHGTHEVKQDDDCLEGSDAEADREDVVVLPSAVAAQKGNTEKTSALPKAASLSYPPIGMIMQAIGPTPSASKLPPRVSLCCKPTETAALGILVYSRNLGGSPRRRTRPNSATKTVSTPPAPLSPRRAELGGGSLANKTLEASLKQVSKEYADNPEYLPAPKLSPPWCTRSQVRRAT